MSDEEKIEQLERKLELSRRLLIHAADSVLAGCGNSYVDSLTERWLKHAASLQAYSGPFVGVISNVRDQWDSHLEKNGMPDLPEKILRFTEG